MNTTDAMEEVAQALFKAEPFDSVSILTPVEGKGPGYVLVNHGGSVLSVTVEILS